MASGTVSVISTFSRQVIDTIKVGTEPFGCALTPDGRRLFVTNQSSGTVSVINTRRDEVIETFDVGEKPHGIAISANGNRVFVTQFLALKPAGDPRPLTQSEGADDGREGRVTVINANNLNVIGTVRLAALADVGAAFKSDGNTLHREPLTTVFDNVSAAGQVSFQHLDRSRRPPPIATEVTDAQLHRFLCRVGTFDPALFTDGVSNEIRANTAVNLPARGDLGFNVPSLISVFASAPYLHSGAAATLDDVLSNVTHRTAGRADHLDLLNTPLFRRFLVQFLKSIDRNTPPILNVTPPASVCGP